MSGIVLSASVRQNLLSLQSTAALLATTQNDLATGNKVNSALDNPTNFFTAQSLNSRASDIGNLLDSIGNGVQVLQAANSGITSLQTLISNAQSIANQVLQAPAGFSTKSQVTSAVITGATANDLLGTTGADATAVEGALQTGGANPATAALATALGGAAGTLTGTAINADAAAIGSPLVTGGAVAATGAATLVGTAGAITGTVSTTGAATLTSLGFANGDSFTVNGKTVSFVTTAPPTTGAGAFTAVTSAATGPTTNAFVGANGNVDIVVGAGKGTVNDLLTGVDLASGVQTLNTTTGAATVATGQTASSVTAGNVTLQSSTNAPLTIAASSNNPGGTANGGLADLATAIGLTPTTTTTTTTPANTTDTFTVSPTAPTSGLGTVVTAGSTLTVDGKTITFANTLPTPIPAGSGNVDAGLQTAANGNSIVSLQSGSIQDVLNAIDLATGVQTASISSGAATLKTTSGDVASSIDNNGKLTISTGANPLTIAAGPTGNALAALGLTAVAAAGTPAGTTPAPAPISSATLLTGATNALVNNNTNYKVGDTLTVNGNTISFVAAPPATGFTNVTSAAGSTSGNVYVNANGDVQIVSGGTTTVGDILTGIDLASGVQTVSGAGTAATGSATLATGQTASSVSATGKVALESSTGADLNITASNSADLTSLGLAATTSGGNAFTATRTPSTSGISSLISAGSSLSIDGKTITFVNALPAATPAGSGVDGAVQTDGNGNSVVSLQTGTIQDILNAIDLATGVQTASIGTGANAGKATLSTTVGDVPSSIDSNGKLNISTGTAQNLTIAAGSGNALTALGLTAGSTVDSSLQGQTLDIASTGGGPATSITFGTDAAAGQVSTLNQLNAQLAANNLQAAISTTGQITISTTNAAASATIGEITGTAAAAGSPFASLTAPPPVEDPTSQAARANLVSQYNTVLQQINTTAQDSSFNGINLLNGDTLSLTFDETGASKLSITGVTFNDAGLGLSTLTAGTDFLDNNSANAVLAQLQNASTTLESEGSALGSNLSIVKIRQDFNASLINVLQTGASNLTLADPNEEAANSQALSTRQSIAVSALALANQSQQSVLQLLR
jgi:flagellin